MNKDFEFAQISLVNEPVCLDAIFMQADKRTHHGRIYGTYDSVCRYNIEVDKYDKAMQILEMLNE